MCSGCTCQNTTNRKARKHWLYCRGRTWLSGSACLVGLSNSDRRAPSIWRERSVACSQQFRPAEFATSTPRLLREEDTRLRPGRYRASLVLLKPGRMTGTAMRRALAAGRFGGGNVVAGAHYNHLHQLEQRPLSIWRVHFASPIVPVGVAGGLFLRNKDRPNAS